MEKIMVIGSSNTDLLIKTNRIPDPGETVLIIDKTKCAGIQNQMRLFGG